MKILESKNYGMFELHGVNRPVEKTNALEISMRKHGWIPAYPAHVSKIGHNRFKVKAGHHRIEVAKRIGIPVKYVVCDDVATIHELETATVVWSMRDYLLSYCRSGKQDYEAVRRYCAETGINIQAAVSMLGGHSAGSGNFGRIFKAGEFKIRNREHADAVAEIVLHMKACGVHAYNAALMVQALSRVLHVPEVKSSQLKQKIKSHTYLIQRQVTLQDYMKMLEEVYNRQSKDKLPLAFLADEAAKQRNVVYAKKK